MAVKSKNPNETPVETEEKAAQVETPVPVAERPKVKASVEKVGVFVYIGPPIKNLIQSGTIYRGTYSDVLKKIEYAVEKYPLIKNFVVSGETLAADRVAIQKVDSLLYKQYNELAKMAG